MNGCIKAGERIVLRGPSGCGKSTLLKHLAGLFPAQGGSLKLGERTLNLSQPQESRPGLVFQGGALFDHLSVFENCQVAVDYNPKYRAWAQDLKRKLILEKLHEVGLNSENQLCYSLSGGERQRVALVRCFLNSPHYLLLDEPLSALDPTLRQSLQQQVLNLLAKTLIPTLIVTHDEHEASVLGTRVIEWPKLDEKNKTLRLNF